MRRRLRHGTGVNDAIRQLIARKRLNATSVMTAANHLGGGEAKALADLNAGERALRSVCMSR